MNDLEKEYKELMNEQVPDLWARIEANLEPKEETTNIKDFSEKKRFKIKYRYMTTSVAAALVVLIGGYACIQFRGNSKTSDNAACAIMEEADCDMIVEEQPDKSRDMKVQENEQNVNSADECEIAIEGIDILATQNKQKDILEVTVQVLDIDPNITDGKASMHVRVISGEGVLTDVVDKEIQVIVSQSDLEQFVAEKQYQMALTYDQDNDLFILISSSENVDENAIKK